MKMKTKIKFNKYIYYIELSRLISLLRGTGLFLVKAPKPLPFIDHCMHSQIDFWSIIIHIIENHIDVPNMVQNYLNQLAGQIDIPEYSKKGMDLLLDPSVWLISHYAWPIIENIYCYMVNPEPDLTRMSDADMEILTYFDMPYTVEIDGETYPNPGNAGNSFSSLETIADRMLGRTDFLIDNPEVLELVQGFIRERDYERAIETMIRWDTPEDNVTGTLDSDTMVAFTYATHIMLVLSNFIEHHIPDNIIFRGFDDLSNIVELDPNDTSGNDSTYVGRLNAYMSTMYTHGVTLSLNLLSILDVYITRVERDLDPSYEVYRSIEAIRHILIYIFTFPHWAAGGRINVQDQPVYSRLMEAVRRMSL